MNYMQKNDIIHMDIEDKIQEYNKTLKEGQNILRIYPWGQLQFDKIYVVPYLSKVPEIDEELHNESEKIGNEESENYEHTSDGMVGLAEDLTSDHPQPETVDDPSFAKVISEKEILSDEHTKSGLAEEAPPSTSILFNGLGHQNNNMVDSIKTYQGHNHKSILVTQMNGFYRKEIPDFYSFAKIQQLRENSIAEREKRISEMFKNDNIVYVIGGAGYGKSLFLRKLCVSPQLVNGFIDKPLLIIRGEIKRLIRNDGTRRSMQEFLEESFTHNSLCDSSEVNQDFITECLKERRCMLLLDALDEVSNEQREAVHDLIISQFTTIFPGNKVCITSRERGFIPRKNITSFYIRSVTSQDVEEFVDRFIAINKFDWQYKKGFVTEATELVRKKFVKGFLTLSLLLSIYHKEGKLPSNKLQLYEKCFEYMANQREKEKDTIRNSRTGQNYNWEHLDIFLTDETFIELAKCGTPNNKDVSERSISRLMQNMYKNEFPSSTSCKLATDEFLQFCADRTEVYVPSQNSNSDYRFFHRSFYEFFYAKYIDKNAKNEEETYEMLRDFDMDSEIYELLTILYKCEGNTNKINSLAKYLFKKAQKSLSNSTNQADHGFDMLTMLMYSFNDEAFLHQFIDLVLQNAEILSGQTLTVNFGMLSTILNRSAVYYMEQFESGKYACLATIQTRILRYYLSHIQECNTLLKRVRSRKYEAITRDEINTQKLFTYSQLILALSNCYEILDQFLLKLANRTHLIAVEKLQNREVNVLHEFASKVNELPPQDRIKIYHYFILEA